MLPQYGPITQTILGTLFTWGLTAAGAGLVIFINGKQVSLYVSLIKTTVKIIMGYLWCLLTVFVEIVKG